MVALQMDEKALKILNEYCNYLIQIQRWHPGVGCSCNSCRGYLQYYKSCAKLTDNATSGEDHEIQFK